MDILHEDSLYNKKRLLESYFWGEIIGELYENTVNIMKQAGVLEESLESFDKSYKIENTARLVLENGVFSDFPRRKGIVDHLINEAFYPESTHELQEGFSSAWDSTKTGFSTAIDAVVRSGKLLRGLLEVLFYFLITPASTSASVLQVRSDKHPTVRKAMAVMDKILFGAVGAVGIVTLSPSMAGFGALAGVGYIWQFMNSDLIQITNYLQKVNTLDNPYIQEVLKDMGADPGALVEKCWRRNKHQPLSPEGEGISSRFMLSFKKGSGNSLNNFLRDPLLTNPAQIASILKNDAADPKYQKMFFDFRTCLYEKIFEIVIGYAQALYSIDDSSYEVIRYANEVHKRKNFKAFFKLQPKEDGEIAMFKVIKLLIAVEEIIVNLKTNKAELIGDKYIDQFIQSMEQQIKQTYQTLDEMAQQRSYNQARYDEENPTDEDKSEAIKKERDEVKQSIFS